MKIINYIVLFLFLTNHTFAQKSSRNEQIQLLENNYREIKEKGTATDAVVEELLALKTNASKINYSEGVLKYTAELMSIYIKRADYNRALQLVPETETLAKQQNDYRNLSVLYGRISEIQKITGYYEQAIAEARKSLYYAKKMPQTDRRFYQIGFADLQLVAAFENRNQDSVLHYAKNSLVYLEKIDESDPELLRLKQSGIMYANMYLGSFYTNNYQPQRLDLAEEHYMKAYRFKETDPKFFKIYELSLMNALGIFYVEKGDYEKAIDFAYKALEIEKRKKKPEDRALSFMTLANSYEKLKQTDLQLKFTKKYTLLSDSLHNAEKRAHETLLQQAVKEKQQKAVPASRNRAFKIGSLIASIVVLVGGLLFYRNRKKNIVSKILRTVSTKTPTLEQEESSETIATEAQENQNATTAIIADKTISTLLKKLEKFEDSDKFLRNDVNLTWLANRLNTNPKYLSGIINQYKGKNFNNYINALRIQYIVKKLEKNPTYREYKISYLAQECGYASSQVFVIAFKKEVGMPPSNFIENLNEKDQQA